MIPAEQIAGISLNAEELMANNLTPTQQKLVDILSDGFPRDADQLAKMLDSQTDRSILKVHISYARAVLDKRGMTIVCDERGGRCMYRLARYINTDE